MSGSSGRRPGEVQDPSDVDGLPLPVPAVVVRARMDLDVSRPHPEEGYDEYPWVGDIVVQWEEQSGTGPVRRETVVWTSAPRWDAPGYSSDDAEDLARRDAADRLAQVLSRLCGDEQAAHGTGRLRASWPGTAAGRAARGR